MQQGHLLQQSAILVLKTFLRQGGKNMARRRLTCVRDIADAILDRLIHNAYRIELKGESMRKKQQIKIPGMVK
jgi:DNA replication protein DnaC